MCELRSDIRLIVFYDMVRKVWTFPILYKSYILYKVLPLYYVQVEVPLVTFDYFVRRWELFVVCLCIDQKKDE